MNEIPKLNREDSDNRVLVGECLLYFIDNHPEFQILKDESFQNMAKNGLIESFCRVFFKAKPKTENLIPWLMDKVFDDLAESKNKTEGQIKDFLDKISKLDVGFLEENYKINQKYNLDPDEMKKDMKNYLNKMSEDDKSSFLFSFFADIILRIETIVVSSYYEIWFGKPYKYSENSIGSYATKSASSSKPEMESSVAVSLENITARYLDVHNDLFKFSFRRIIPIPGFLEKINYLELLTKLQDIKSQLILERSKLNENVFESENIIAKDENFFSASSSYVQKITESVTLLIGIVEKLQQKTLGDKTYTHQQYQEDVSLWEKMDKDVSSLYDQMAKAYNPDIYK